MNNIQFGRFPKFDTRVYPRTVLSGLHVIMLSGLVGLVNEYCTFFANLHNSHVFASSILHPINCMVLGWYIIFILYFINSDN